MNLEEELINLCHRFFDAPRRDKAPDKISSFFSRLIKFDKKVQITDEIRYFIPFLASYDGGVLCSFLESCIDGISPMHYVPDLQLSPYMPNTPRSPSKSARSGRNPRNKNRKKTAKTARSSTKSTPQTDINDLHVQELTIPLNRGSKASRPRSARRSINHKKVLPPMNQTQDDVISNLYIRDNNNFFVAKKLEEKAIDLHIVPPNYPKHMIGEKFSILSGTGVITLNNNSATAVDLPQFVEDQANMFIVERQLFKLHNAFRCFYTWRDRYRERQFRKIITAFDDLDAVSRPGFNSLLDRIRQSVVERTEKLCIYETAFDAKMEEVEFEELKLCANKSLLEMDDCTLHLASEMGTEISEFFRQIRATNLLMQLDFDELHSLNALPPSLQTFASDLKWRFPSIWRQKLREKLLIHERKIALKRQNYLGRFFSKVYSIFTGNLILQCKRILMGFLHRFSTNCQMKRRIHKVYATFDSEKGMKIIPSKNDFLRWISLTVEEVKVAFLQKDKQISTDVIIDVDPEYELYEENPKTILSRFKELNDLEEDALNEINAVYTFFHLEIHNHAYFLKKLKDSVDHSASFTELREVENLETIINELIKSEVELQNRPKNLFHKILDNDETTDFVLDMRPALDLAAKYLQEGIANIKARIINELNINIFTEIQEKWSTVKETKITRDDCRYLEIRMVLYSVLCDTIITAWKDTTNELKGTFDTIMRMYRALNEKCRYTHIEAISSFNLAAEKVGLSIITPRKNNLFEDYDDDEEEEEEEEEELNDNHEEKEEVITTENTEIIEVEENSFEEEEENQETGTNYSQSEAQTVENADL